MKNEAMRGGWHILVLLVVVSLFSLTTHALDTVPPSPDAQPSGDDGGLTTPAIAILNVPSPRVITMGGSVTYEYTVWNIAADQNQTVTDVTVTDDHCSPVVFLYGDRNGDGKLNEGENWEYSCITTLTETTTNTAIATGYQDDVNHQLARATTTTTVVVVPDQGLFQSVPAPDTTETPAPVVPLFPDLGFVVAGEFYSSTGLLRPFIHVTRAASRFILVPFGNKDVTYTYTVTNPGDVPVSNIAVSDNVCASISYVSGDTNHNGLLHPNETWTYTCTTSSPVSTRSITIVAGRAHGFTPAAVVVTDPVLTDTNLVLLLVSILMLLLAVRTLVLRKLEHKKNSSNVV